MQIFGDEAMSETRGPTSQVPEPLVTQGMQGPGGPQSKEPSREQRVEEAATPVMQSLQEPGSSPQLQAGVDQIPAPPLFPEWNPDEMSTKLVDATKQLLPPGTTPATAKKPSSDQDKADDAYTLALTHQRINQMAHEAGFESVYSDENVYNLNGHEVLFLEDRIIILGIEPREAKDYIEKLKAEAGKQGAPQLLKDKKKLIDKLDAGTAQKLTPEKEKQARDCADDIAKHVLHSILPDKAGETNDENEQWQLFSAIRESKVAEAALHPGGLRPLKKWKQEQQKALRDQDWGLRHLIRTKAEEEKKAETQRKEAKAAASREEEEEEEEGEPLERRQQLQDQPAKKPEEEEEDSEDGPNPLPESLRGRQEIELPEVGQAPTQ